MRDVNKLLKTKTLQNTLPNVAFIPHGQFIVPFSDKLGFFFLKCLADLKIIYYFFNFQFSQNGSVGLSRQDSGGSLPVAKATKKTSRTNLSEASADTGIIGDIDNKVKPKYIFKDFIIEL